MPSLSCATRPPHCHRQKLYNPHHKDKSTVFAIGKIAFAFPRKNVPFLGYCKKTCSSNCHFFLEVPGFLFFGTVDTLKGNPVTSTYFRRAGIWIFSLFAISMDENTPRRISKSRSHHLPRNTRLGPHGHQGIGTRHASIAPLDLPDFPPVYVSHIFDNCYLS